MTRLVAAVAVAASLLPLAPVSAFAAHDDGMDMACCAENVCRTPALSTPCCGNSTSGEAPLPVHPASHRVPAPAVAAPWDAQPLDLVSSARQWRARAMADLLRDRPPDSPHLLNGVFLI